MSSAFQSNAFQPSGFQATVAAPAILGSLGVILTNTGKTSAALLNIVMGAEISQTARNGVIVTTARTGATTNTGVLKAYVNN